MMSPERNPTTSRSANAEASRAGSEFAARLRAIRLLVIATFLTAGTLLMAGASFPTGSSAEDVRDGQAGPEVQTSSDTVGAAPDPQAAPTGFQPFELRVARREGPIYRVPIVGVIELGLAPFVERAINEAATAEASVIILDVDTPGGRVDAAKRIADAVGNSEIPVYAFVNPEASSAGALISIATDGIFMRPTATIGAAAPVDGAGEMAPEKMVSAMRSTMRSLAQARGLDPAIAEAMVDEDLSVEGVIESGKLLTLTTNEAVELNYARFVEGWDDMLGALGVQENRVVAMEVNWAERIVRFLSHPVVAPFLLSLGFLGLLVEIKTPGFGVAGGAGVLALSLFFGSHLIIGLAGAEGLIIFGVGVVLLLAEVFLVPGVGVLGILGGIGMLVGVYLSLLGGLPASEDYARASSVLAASMTMIVISSWFLLRRLPANRRLTRLGIFLGESTDRETGYTSSVRRDELRNLEGVAMTDLRPSGTGVFGDERVDVVSESEWIEAGSPIRIVSSEGYRHVVRPVTAPKAVEAHDAPPEPDFPEVPDA